MQCSSPVRSRAVLRLFPFNLDFCSFSVHRTYSIHMSAPSLSSPHPLKDQSDFPPGLPTRSPKLSPMANPTSCHSQFHCLLVSALTCLAKIGIAANRRWQLLLFRGKIFKSRDTALLPVLKISAKRPCSQGRRDKPMPMPIVAMLCSNLVRSN